MLPVGDVLLPSSATLASFNLENRTNRRYDGERDAKVPIANKKVKEQHDGRTWNAYNTEFRARERLTNRRNLLNMFNVGAKNQDKKMMRNALESAKQLSTGKAAV